MVKDSGRGVLGMISRKIWKTITFDTNKKLQFRDTGLYIYSDADGSIRVVSDGLIKLDGSVTDVGTTFIADGAISVDTSLALLDSSAASVDLTIAAPSVGRHLVIACLDKTNTPTVTLTAGTYDGSNNVATFDAANESLVLYGISATRFLVVENIGSVALS